MLLIIVVTFIVIFVIEGCTTINLSPKLLINKSEYEKFPNLDNGLEFGKYEMERIAKTNGAELSYFPQNNFFLISSDSKPGTYNPVKIDNLGRKVFELSFDEQSDFKLLDYMNGFVIGANAIYDFSADSPKEEEFYELLNKEKNIDPNNWVKQFEDHYRSADIVLYSQHTELVSAQCVYFRIAGKWTKLYEFNHPGRQFIYPDGAKIKCRINDVEMPPKLNEEHFLKDVQQESYSNYLRYSDDYIKRDNKTFPDQALNYKQVGTISTLAFSKEASTNDGYSLGIPNTFYGTAYYKLSIDSNILNFKTVAFKFIGLKEKVQTSMYLFSLPEKFSAKTSVSFLTYDYGTNFYDNGKKGIYVLRRKLAKN